MDRSSVLRLAFADPEDRQLLKETLLKAMKRHKSEGQIPKSASFSLLEQHLLSGGGYRR